MTRTAAPQPTAPPNVAATPSAVTARALAARFAGTRLAAFLRGAEGVAAVEFALVLPVMLTMYLGMVEVTQAVAADRKSTLLSRTLSDLTAQAAGLTTAETDAIFDASKTVLAPFDDAPATMRITSVWIDGLGTPRVEWSVGKGLPAHGQCSSAAALVPAGLKVVRTSVIIGEVRYLYKPVIGYVVTGDIDLEEKTYMRPRLKDRVDYNNNTTLCPGSVV